jgi:hypothetical protein
MESVWIAGLSWAIDTTSTLEAESGECWEIVVLVVVKSDDVLVGCGGCYRDGVGGFWAGTAGREMTAGKGESVCECV